MSNLEANQEKVNMYLRYIIDASNALNNNQGSWRKDIWDYVQKKNVDIDYRDFLISIKKFLHDGTLVNTLGIYSVPPQVIQELQDQKSSPLSKSHIVTSLDSKRLEASSKISNIGKQAKVRNRMIQLGGKQDIKEKDERNKLGFQTPINRIIKSPKQHKVISEVKQKQLKELRGIAQKMMAQKQAITRKKLFDNRVSKMSKRIIKTKKVMPKVVQTNKITSHFQQVVQKKKESPKKVKEMTPVKKVNLSELKKRVDKAIKLKNLKVRKYKEKKVKKTLNLSKRLGNSEKKKKSKSSKKEMKARRIEKTAPKKQNKTKQIKKSISKKEQKHVDVKKSRKVFTKKQRIEKIMKKLINGRPLDKMDKERKAKVQAAKNIKHLYSKCKDLVFVNEKLIYTL